MVHVVVVDDPVDRWRPPMEHEIATQCDLGTESIEYTAVHGEDRLFGSDVRIGPVLRPVEADPLIVLGAPPRLGECVGQGLQMALADAEDAPLPKLGAVKETKEGIRFGRRVTDPNPVGPGFEREVRGADSDTIEMDAIDGPVGDQTILRSRPGEGSTEQAAAE
jgi:hypothetical protein